MPRKNNRCKEEDPVTSDGNNTKVQQFFNPITKDEQYENMFQEFAHSVADTPIGGELSSTPINPCDDVPPKQMYPDPKTLAIRETHHHPITHLISFASDINPHEDTLPKAKAKMTKLFQFMLPYCINFYIYIMFGVIEKKWPNSSPHILDYRPNYNGHLFIYSAELCTEKLKRFLANNFEGIYVKVSYFDINYPWRQLAYALKDQAKIQFKTWIYFFNEKDKEGNPVRKYIYDQKFIDIMEEHAYTYPLSRLKMYDDEEKNITRLDHTRNPTYYAVHVLTNYIRARKITFDRDNVIMQGRKITYREMAYIFKTGDASLTRDHYNKTPAAFDKLFTPSEFYRNFQEYYIKPQLPEKLPKRLKTQVESIIDPFTQPN